jgi:hypothetical protein
MNRTNRTKIIRGALLHPHVYAMLLLLAAPAPAGQHPSAGAAAEPPASATPQPEARSDWLRVTAERVNLRSRADLNSRIVGRVNRDDVLAARAAENGWHRVVPPPGVFSLVAAQYIRRADEQRGVVDVDTSLRVRVGSDIQPRDPLLSEVQTRLERGTEVTILGELEGGWLKISPPEGVYVYISADYVELVDAEQAERLRAARAAAAPADSAAVGRPTTQPAEPPAPADPWGPRLARLVQRIEAEQRKPVAQQAWDPIRLELQALAAQRETPEVARHAIARLAEISQRVERQRVARTAGDAARPRAAEARQGPRFDARGTLRPSFALPPGPYGLRYQLEEPLTCKRVAYLEFPTELGIDIPACVGKYVGIRGERQTLAGANVSILRVTRLTVLDPDKPAEPPAREKP